MSHILLVTAHYEGTGGIQTLTRELENALKKYTEHTVDVIYIDPNTDYWAPNDLVPRPSLITADDLRHLRWPFRNAVARRTKEYLRRTTQLPDVVHALHVSCWPALRIARQELNNPTCVLSTHLQEFRQKKSMNQALDEADVVHAVSNSTARVLTEHFNKVPRVYVAYPLLDLTSYEEAVKNFGRCNNPQQILTLSRLAPVKNINTLIRAWQLVSFDDPTELIIAGEGPARPKLERLAEDDDSIRFIGHVDESEKYKTYAESTAFALPSTRRGHHGFDREGFGIVYLEAQASGLPCLASDEGGAPEAVGDGGVIVQKEQDPVKVASGLETLLDNIEKLRSKAFEHAAQASPDMRVSQYRPIYQ